MKSEPSVIVDDSMTGVSTALKSDHDIRLVSEQVSYLAFAFVTPIGADYCSYYI